MGGWAIWPCGGGRTPPPTGCLTPLPAASAPQSPALGQSLTLLSSVGGPYPSPQVLGDQQSSVVRFSAMQSLVAQSSVAQSSEVQGSLVQPSAVQSSEVQSSVAQSSVAQSSELRSSLVQSSEV